MLAAVYVRMASRDFPRKRLVGVDAWHKVHTPGRHRGMSLFDQTMAGYRSYSVVEL